MTSSTVSRSSGPDAPRPVDKPAEPPLQSGQFLASDESSSSPGASTVAMDVAIENLFQTYAKEASESDIDRHAIALTWGAPAALREHSRSSAR